jgi:hypothetical protein
MTPQKPIPSYDPHGYDEDYSDFVPSKKSLLFHALSILFCITAGFFFAMCWTWATVNIANQILK